MAGVFAPLEIVVSLRNTRVGVTVDGGIDFLLWRVPSLHTFQGYSRLENNGFACFACCQGIRLSYYLLKINPSCFCCSVPQLNTVGAPVCATVH